MIAHGFCGLAHYGLAWKICWVFCFVLIFNFLLYWIILYSSVFDSCDFNLLSIVRPAGCEEEKQTVLPNILPKGWFDSMGSLCTFNPNTLNLRFL